MNDREPNEKKISDNKLNLYIVDNDASRNPNDLKDIGNLKKFDINILNDSIMSSDENVSDRTLEKIYHEVIDYMYENYDEMIIITKRKLKHIVQTVLKEEKEIIAYRNYVIRHTQSLFIKVYHRFMLFVVGIKKLLYSYIEDIQNFFTRISINDKK